MDVKCEPSCVFSTGSCSDSVRELACKPAPNKITMVSCEVAASLLLLQLGLMWVLPLDLVRAFFVFTLRVFLLLLFFEGNKGDQLHRGGTGRPQVQGRVSRIASAAS